MHWRDRERRTSQTEWTFGAHTHTHERNDLLRDFPKAKYFVWSNHLHLFKYLYPIYSLFSESIPVRRKIDQDALRFSDLSNHTAAFPQAAVFITVSVHPILNCLIFRNSDASFPPIKLDSISSGQWESFSDPVFLSCFKRILMFMFIFIFSFLVYFSFFIDIYTMLNAWIWLADKRSEMCNYFPANVRRT